MRKGEIAFSILNLSDYADKPLATRKGDKIIYRLDGGLWTVRFYSDQGFYSGSTIERFETAVELARWLNDRETGEIV